MKTQTIAKKALFVAVLGIIFAIIGYFAYPVLFEIVIGADIERAAAAPNNLDVSLTNPNMMAIWFAALGLAIGVGTLMCSVESTKNQIISYFIFLLVLAIGFAVVWAYLMRTQFTSLIFGLENNSSLNIMEYASFYEIPQFAAVAVLVISLIIFVKKTKDH